MSRFNFLVLLSSVTAMTFLAVGSIVYAAEDSPISINRIAKPMFQTNSVRESLAQLSKLPTPALKGLPGLEKSPHLISVEPDINAVLKVPLDLKEAGKDANASSEEPLEESTSQESTLPPKVISDSEQKPSGISQSETTTSVPGVYPYRAKFLRTPAEAMRLSDEFLLHIVARKYDKAFEIIRPHFPISDYKHKELLEGSKKRLGLAELRFGRPLDYVFIKADTVGETILRYRYLQKFDLETLLWEFTFYKPQTGWLLNAVSFEAESGQVFND